MKNSLSLQDTARACYGFREPGICYSRAIDNIVAISASHRNTTYNIDIIQKIL